MEKIYHIYKTSNSYWNNESYQTDYYLCDTEEEYQRLLAEHKAKRQKIEDEWNEVKDKYNFNAIGIYIPNEARYREHRYHHFRLIEEGKVHASEYYYGHEWQGKTFDAEGFGWDERLERGTVTTYYLKPGSVGKVTPCTDRGIGWMYGS